MKSTMKKCHREQWEKPLQDYYRYRRFATFMLMKRKHSLPRGAFRGVKS